jgi:ParB-like chromosome segregation protein Spo0J
MTAPTPAPSMSPPVRPKPYEPHPLADIFPLLDKDGLGFNALVADIKERGQQEPIWLFEGKILDGRNRYRACLWLGCDVKVQEYKGDDPVGHVLSSNLHRRHLDESQRAMVGAKLTNLEVGANQHTKGQGTSIDGASKLLNVGRASIERARKVLAGSPELVAAVEQGKVSVSSAAKTGEIAPKTSGPRRAPDKLKEYAKAEDKLIEKLNLLSSDAARLNAGRTIEAINETLAELEAKEEKKAA